MHRATHPIAAQERAISHNPTVAGSVGAAAVVAAVVVAILAPVTTAVIAIVVASVWVVKRQPYFGRFSIANRVATSRQERANVGVGE